MKKDDILITDQIIREFAEFSGDKNPLHLDESFAARGPFKKRIAHGTIILAKISKLITDVVGEGSILLSEEVKFLKPVFIDDKISLKTSKNIQNDKGVNELFIEAVNQNNQVVLECRAICKRLYIKNDNKLS
jgi:acyl dehydratase